MSFFCLIRTEIWPSNNFKLKFFKHLTFSNLTDKIFSKTRTQSGLFTDSIVKVFVEDLTPERTGRPRKRIFRSCLPFGRNCQLLWTTNKEVLIQIKSFKYSCEDQFLLSQKKEFSIQIKSFENSCQGQSNQKEFETEPRNINRKK